MNYDKDELLQRWVEFFKMVNARGNPIEFFHIIENAYSIPKRFYHTLEGHISHCIWEFDQVRHLAEFPDEDEFSLWTHDSIYDVRRLDNEERSARFADSLALKMGMPYEFRERSSGYIILTKHDLSISGLEPGYGLDCDLTIFGQTEKEFNEYEMGIFKEYESVINEIGWEKAKCIRLGILEEFLQRDTIYCKQYFIDKYEKQARRNLERSIRKLRCDKEYKSPLHYPPSEQEGFLHY